MSELAATDHALAESDERGRTVVADRVIEKTAARVAGEVAQTAELDRKLSDRLPGRRTPHARVSSVISGHLVQLRLTIGVEYPVAIVTVTREVRKQVRETVSRLCDVDVRDVDVVVDRLRRPGGIGRRVN